jgi:hypothetical protein
MPTSNRILDPGNMQVANPYFISARTGILAGLAAAAPVATLVNFGTVINGAAVPMSLHISQIRLKWTPDAGAPTTGTAFEVLLGTATVQHNTNGAARVAQKRNRNIPDIPITEVSLYASATAAISGGNFAPDDATAPFDMMTLGSGTDLAGAELIWTPSDLQPIEIPAGRAVEVRARGFAGTTGILLAAFDFLR